MIRTITFDLDDTLWPVDAVLEHAELTCEQWLQQHCPKLFEKFDRAELLKLRKQLYRQRPDLHHQISKLREESLRIALQTSGYPSHRARRLSRRAFDVFLRARHAVEPFTEVETCLTLLRKHYQLGVITNGNANVFHTPLRRYFDFMISAENVNASKPAPRPFIEAMKHARCTANEMLHIGDNPDHDISGAEQLGIQALWYNPNHSAWPLEAPAPQQFDNFANLAELLVPHA